MHLRAPSFYFVINSMETVCWFLSIIITEQKHIVYIAET